MKYTLYIIILLSLMSCNNEKLFFSHDTVKEYSKGDFKTPSVYGYLSTFIMVEKHELASTNINLLYTMYVTDYTKSYNNFESFLFEALNQKLVFPEDYVTKRNGIVFTLNDEVTRNYEKLMIHEFLNKYCEKDGEEWSVKNEYIEENTLSTILYYLFINSYEVSNDDYIGKYYVKKKEIILKH